MNRVELHIDLKEEPPEARPLREFAEKIFNEIFCENCRMGLVLTNNDSIRKLNYRWRGKKNPTDVLSFPQMDTEDIPCPTNSPVEIGDIVISLDMVAYNAEQWETSYNEELRRVVIHGILHLHGMDHPDDDYESGMLKLQEELLTKTESFLVDEEHG